MNNKKQFLSIVLCVFAIGLTGCKSGNDGQGGLLSSSYIEKYTEFATEMDEAFKADHGSMEQREAAERKFEEVYARWEVFKKDAEGKSFPTEVDESLPLKITSPFAIVFPENDGQYYVGPMMEALGEVTDDSWNLLLSVVACADDEPIALLDVGAADRTDRNKRGQPAKPGDTVVIRGRLWYSYINSRYPAIARVNRFYICDRNSEYITDTRQKIRAANTGFSYR